MKYFENLDKGLKVYYSAEKFGEVVYLSGWEVNVNYRG